MNRRQAIQTTAAAISASVATRVLPAEAGTPDVPEKLLALLERTGENQDDSGMWVQWGDGGQFAWIDFERGLTYAAYKRGGDDDYNVREITRIGFDQEDV